MRALTARLKNSGYNNMTQDEQWTENKEKIDDTDYGLVEEDETGEDHGKGTYDCLEEPDQEPEAVESEGVELEW